jgi:uncharacterized protein YegP (UPF0339 family)
MATAIRKVHAAKQVASGAVGVSESGAMEFLVFRDNGGEYHWRIVAGSGESLAQSGSFATHKDAEHAARYVYQGVGSARFDAGAAEEHPLGRVTSPRHLSCPRCRVRLHASANEVDLLLGMCPICDMSLGPASSGSDVMGFRLLDLDVLRDQESSAPPSAVRHPVDFEPRRPAAQEDLDAERWLDEGGGVGGEAVAEWPAAH